MTRLDDLLAADPSTLRHSDWVELQTLARGELAIDRVNLEELKPIAARMREIASIVAGGKLLDRERLLARFDRIPEGHFGDDAANLAIETAQALIAGLMSDGARDAYYEARDAYYGADGWQVGITALLRHVLGGELPEDETAKLRARIEELDVHVSTVQEEHARAAESAYQDSRRHEKEKQRLRERIEELEKAHRDSVENAYQDSRRHAERHEKEKQRLRERAQALAVEVEALRALGSSTETIEALVAAALSAHNHQSAIGAVGHALRTAMDADPRADTQRKGKPEDASVPKVESAAPTHASEVEPWPKREPIVNPYTRRDDLFSEAFAATVDRLNAIDADLFARWGKR